VACRAFKWLVFALSRLFGVWCSRFRLFFLALEAEATTITPIGLLSATVI